MKVSINGEVDELRQGATVADAVERVHPADLRRGLAAAVNGEVVPRDEWTDWTLDDDDEVEVLRAIGGGGS